MIRKHNDSVKDGVGIGGAKDQRFTKTNKTDPWNVNPPRDVDMGRSSPARSAADDSYKDRSDYGIDDGIGERDIRGVAVDFESNYAAPKWAGTGTQRRGSRTGNMPGAYDIFDDVVDNSDRNGFDRTGVPIRSWGQD
jgi:hypothetical protein